MTLPGLVANYKIVQYKTGFKKTLSVINQSVNMTKAKYDFDFSSVTSNCINLETDSPDKIQSMCSIFNSTLNNAKINDYRTLKLNNNQFYYQEVYNNTTPDTLLKEYHIELNYYQMTDGSLLGFHTFLVSSPNEITKCSLKYQTLEEAMQDDQFKKYCIGFIDVNGTLPPNKEIRCDDGKSHPINSNNSCIVPNNDKYFTDVFPIVFYDSVVAPASEAAKYALLH